ncbi:Ribonucleotide reductase of class II (coenzyme B12-dependent) [Fulvivirga imtechensis AK7]|uniref:Vitamin B12-dependent ribonucleotide reductase n=1 Tax=Fulvivirga imtechensis AK7 TaxID=1237149 RepID=L8JQ84_9BACT|nr:Ribonucleotide reductase of class II (coenzyme B12-dependent) [Fulvivirga imtechensis AK7]
MESRYLRRDKYGNLIETPKQLFQRVAHAVAQAELQWGTDKDASCWERRFLDVMMDLRFLPNSPTLMNAGTPSGQLSACFVLPVYDHLADIFSALRLAALIQQHAGGTGFNFSHLRPKNDRLHRTQGTAAGPVSFMKIFNATTEYVKQGGKRRGANMGILGIDHPDIEEFITCKRKEGNLRNFNISIGISDAFMAALEQDASWKLIHPNTQQVVKKIKARQLWDLVTESAWTSGDPGLIFLDTINTFNPTPDIGKIEATNPCGEVPLLSNESCNLGSINLSRFVDDHQGQTTLDWNGLAQTVNIAVRFLDNVIEINNYLSPEMRKIALGNRKIGLGVMGWAEALSKLEIPYESNKAVHLAERLMKFIAENSWNASKGLCKERGVFQNWEKSIYYPNSPVRNATRTSIAPTGTISIIADTSSSIEPFFALAYQRQHILQDETLEEINNSLIRYMQRHQIEPSVVTEHIQQTGTLSGLVSIPEKMKNIFKTALEIAPLWHLRHQTAFQKYTDNAVSKTINLPKEATREDVDFIYKTAWREGLKGITIFRYHSRNSQVIQKGILSDVNGCKVCIE